MNVEHILISKTKSNFSISNFFEIQVNSALCKSRDQFIHIRIYKRKGKKTYFKIAKHLQILIFFSVIFSSCRFFSQISDGTIFSSPSVCDSSTTANITRLLLLVSKALTRSINSLLSQRRRWHLRRKMWKKMVQEKLEKLVIDSVAEKRAKCTRHSKFD